MKQIHNNLAQEQAKPRTNYRNRVELLRRRVHLLVGTDRTLMTMYLTNGNTFRQLASLAGVNETTIARRIDKLARRLTEGQYISCLRYREKLSDTEMAVARDYFLCGFSIRKVAQRHNCTYYRVRQILAQIRRKVPSVPAKQSKTV